MENKIIEDLKTYLIDDELESVYVLDSNDENLINLPDYNFNKEELHYDLEPIVIAKKSTYTQAHRRAQQKYREKYPEKYCEAQRKLYEEKKKDEQWKNNFNERSRKNNKIYREKKNNEIIQAGGEIRKRGRPKKITNIEINIEITPTKEEVVDTLYSA
jgi:dolichyl-phosphate-mannose--protein O-mannosyl transferase